MKNRTTLEHLAGVVPGIGSPAKHNGNAKHHLRRSDLDPSEAAERDAIRAEAGDSTPVEQEAPHDPVLVRMCDVAPKSIKWVFRGKIASGRLTLFVGVPGGGKSFVTVDFGARVTTGTPWPDGSPCPTGSVLFIAAEDDPADTIRPRADAAGADVSKFYLMTTVRRKQEDGTRAEVMFSLSDLPALETAIQRVGDLRLIIIDPIGSFLGGRVDAHRDNEVRSVLAPLAKLAEKYDVAVVIVAHRRKSSGSSADDSALGSRAFTGICRAVHHFSRDPLDRNRRFMLPGKNNLAPEGTGLAFTIRGDPVGRVHWEREPVEMTADEGLANEQDARPGPAPTARKEASAWLQELLAGGPRPAEDVKAESKAAGFSWATIRRAADELRVKREKCPFADYWQWRLLKTGTKLLSLSNTEGLSNLSNLSTSSVDKGLQEEGVHVVQVPPVRARAREGRGRSVPDPHQ